jgi:hypothetical protein
VTSSGQHSPGEAIRPGAPHFVGNALPSRTGTAVAIHHNCDHRHGRLRGPRYALKVLHKGELLASAEMLDHLGESLRQLETSRSKKSTDDQAAAIRKYEGALTTLLFYARTGRQFHFNLKTQFQDVSLDVEGYKNTSEYHDAVFRADSRARDLANLVRSSNA